MAGHDHFTDLPTELKHNIMDYLHTSHFPDKAKLEIFGRYKAPTPDLLSLARVSKSIYAEVSSWANTYLLKHKKITKYREYKTAKAAAKQRPLNKLLHFTNHNCAFCGKATKRTSILMNSLKCCTKCDKVHWPNKLTKTQAKQKYMLDEYILLPPLTRTGRNPPGFRRPRYGTYICQGVVTTMFDEADVVRFAELAHGGDLQAKMKKREQAKLERQRRQLAMAASRV